MQLQEKTSEVLKQFNDNDHLKHQYLNNQLTLISTFLPKCNGLSKIHKKDIPMRPIISLINSPTQFLAKVIDEELKNCSKLPQSHVKDSFTPEDKKNILDDDHVLLSLDVSSLFINISCSLVLDSLYRRLFFINKNCKTLFGEIRDYVRFLFNNTFLRLAIRYTNKFMVHQWVPLSHHYSLT